jgi:hypothetical protein
MKKGWPYQLRLTFFGLTQEYKLQLYEQIFEMCYYSEGAFRFMDVYQLPIYLRNFYFKKLLSVKQKENDKIKDGKSKSSGPPKIAKPF